MHAPLGEYAGPRVKTEKAQPAPFPGAAHLEWSDVLDKRRRSAFKSPEEIEKSSSKTPASIRRSLQWNVLSIRAGRGGGTGRFALELMGAKRGAQLLIGSCPSVG